MSTILADKETARARTVATSTNCDHDAPRQRFRFLRSGWFAILISAFLMNPVWIEWALAPNGRLPEGHESIRYIFYAFQICVGLLALLYLYRKRSKPVRMRFRTLFAWLFMASLVYGNLRATRVLDFEAEIRAISIELARTETTIQSLNPILKKLGVDTRNHSLPTNQTADQHFAPNVVYRGIQPNVEPNSSHRRLSWERYSWSVAKDSVTLAGDDRTNFWKPLFEHLDYLDYAKFKQKTGRFVGSENRFEGKVKFSAAGKTKSGEAVGISAYIDIAWVRDASPPEASSSWRISEWKTKDMQVQTAERPMFSEVTSQVMDAETYEGLRHSKQEDHILKHFNDEEVPFGFSLASADRRPGVSVVDINRDGFDDVYVTLRWEKNKMLLNNQGAGFVDVAAEMGLDIDGYTTSVVFADFDNDGDDDAFMGRSVLPAVYLENVDGKFVDRSAELGIELPCLATSLSAADYDGDGLLDLFVATSAAYQIAEEIKEMAPAAVVGRFLSAKLTGGRMPTPGGTLLADFLPQEESQNVTDLFWKNIEKTLSDQHGPPSLLLRNLGGNKFCQSDAIPKVYRNTLQGAWSDYDNDGDPDLYLANDFAKNVMLRNDDGKFVDVTQDTDTADVGFGMGASWGDYDEDGLQDLYVSNMYSTAGSRITSLLGDRLEGGLEEVFGRMARGNSLFRNQSATPFEKVSGLTAEDQPVEVVGWSWGSQFLDADNDGFLDVYATSGFYSAPPEIELAEDL